MKKSPPITFETLIITPKIAEEWYILSGGNRPIRKRHVAFLANEMKTNWELNGEPIIFDWNGKLIEGHHRLIACAEYGVSFESVVVRGVDPSAKATINTGVSRTGGDALSYAGAGYVCTGDLSTTVARLLDYESGRMAQPKNTKYSNATIVQRAAKCKGLEESINAVRKCKGMIAASRLAWLHYLVSQQAPEEAQEFFDRLADGLELSQTNPIYLLRTRLSNAKMNRRMIPLPEGCALLIKAWNAHRRHRPIKCLRWTNATEIFPKIEGI